MSLIVYGIPTCGTVRKARKWLDDHGASYQFIDLREDPPSRQRVEAWVKALGPKPLRNTSGKAYRGLGDEKKTWDADKWTEAFVGEPMLLKRPIIERDGQPVQVGFKGHDVDLAARLLV